MKLNGKMKWNIEWRTLMVRACSELREALAKVSSSTKTALFRSSFWSDSRFEAISVRLVMAPLHLSLPLPLSSIAIFSHRTKLFGLFTVILGNGPVLTERGIEIPPNPKVNNTPVFHLNFFIFFFLIFYFFFFFFTSMAEIESQPFKTIAPLI